MSVTDWANTTVPYAGTPMTATQVGNVSLWPLTCSGNVHVWACDHTRVCKCGDASRALPLPKCPVCGG
jgi:hypothetical protein